MVAVPIIKERNPEMKSFLSALGTVALFIALVFGLNALGYINTAFFAPKYEAVRRDTMIQSRAYGEATTRELYRLKLQYQQAKTDDEKATVRAFALHESAAFDRDRLPTDLQSFIAQLGG